MATSTTTTTMRASQRVLLEAFPVPPSHIPYPANPPPSGPPSLPLPPVPGPSRVSMDEQLLFLSSVANRSRRSSKYSVASSHRDSVISIGSIGPGSSSTRASIVGSPVAKAAVLPSSTTSSRRDSLASPRTPTFFTRPSISVSSAPTGRLMPGDQLTRLSASPLLLSDIEDDESEPIPSRMPSPFLDSSWRRSKHQPNESISSIDVRAILGVDADGTDEPLDAFLSRPLSSPLSPPQPHSAPPGATFSQARILSTLPVSPKSVAKLQMLADRKNQLPDSLSANRTTSSSSNSPSSPLPSILSSSTSVSDVGSGQDNLDDQNVNPTLTVKDLRLERRAERTKSAGLKKELAVRSRSRPRGPVGIASPIPEPAEVLPPIKGSTSMSPVLIMKTTHQARKDDMTLDELGPPPQGVDMTVSRLRSNTISSTIAFPTQNEANMSPQTEPPRTPSPDIDSILFSTPRPVLKKAASQSRIRSQGIVRRRIDSASNPDYRRRASEGVIREMRSTPSWHGHDGSELHRNRTLSRSSHGMSEFDAEFEKQIGSEDETRTKQAGDDDESDSSIDLHTPLPHLMVRDGLLSPNSRLLPTTSRRRDGRSSVMTTCSTLTKTGIMKDERDTPMRRVRHRDNRLLKGGIGLTTGLGWSDSEDENAPSPLTRRLSTLNLSRRSSASSVRTSGSVVSHRHPLSRSYSSGALIESELEHLEDVDEETAASLSVRPRLPSTGRLSKTAIPPTSWLNKGTTPNRHSGTRTSTSSVGSTFSVDTTLSDGVPRRPSKLGRPSSGLRGSSGSPELGRKGSTGNDRTSSSTASTLSTGGPVTPRDYDPTMSSPAGFGVKHFNMEKSLPPLPNGVLKKRPLNSRLDTLSSNFSFPRARTLSSTTSLVPSPSPTSPSGSPVRPLHLPRQSTRVGGGDRAAVPVPSVVPTPSQVYNRPSDPRSPPSTKTDLPAEGAVRPRPRTGTGMVYRTSSGSRIRAPMTLTSSTSLLERNSNLPESTRGSIGRANGSRIPPL